MQDPKIVAQAVLDALPPAVLERPVLVDTARLLATEVVEYAAGSVNMPAAQGNGLLRMLCADLEAAPRLAAVLTPPAGDDRKRRVLEISNGAGFPGFVLGRLCPQAQIDVLEPDLRRAWLLKRMINLASVRNLRVRLEGVESLTAAPLESYDLVLVQTASIAAAVRQAVPLLRPGGALALWQDDEPHEAALHDAGRDFRLSVPPPYVFSSKPLRGHVLMLAQRPDEAPALPPPSPQTAEDPVSA